jgi:ElaB/YqjD/DUF883 family membrane-anchored ribosome-binding protein
MTFALEEIMDQQQLQDVASETAERTGKMASGAASQARASVQDALDQGKTMLQDMQASTGETVEKASTMARETAKTGGQAMARAGEVIQGVAREAGNQASQAATNLYQQGTRTREQVSQYVAEQPLTALLIAAAIGYGLAYLIHGSGRPLLKQ